MALQILRQAQKTRASLQGFVVMTHHIHLVVTPDEESTISDFMRDLKSASSRMLSPMLSQFEREQLKQQLGLNRSQFWKSEFRANPIITQRVFEQKLHYTHYNPVRAGYCEAPELYLWSGYHAKHEGHGDMWGNVNLTSAIGYYESML